VQSAVWNIGMRNNQGFVYDAESNLLYGSSHGPYSDDEINIIEGFRNYGHPIVIGKASDGNYNGTAANSLSTSITAGCPYSTTSGNSTCPKIVDEMVNVATINAQPWGQYKDPLFTAYAGDVSGSGSVKYIWANTTGDNSGWPSEGWSGIDLYKSNLIPGWKKSLIAGGLKWGRLIRLKLGSTGQTIVPTAGADTTTYFQSVNRYRDLAFGPNGKDIYIITDNSSATSGPGTGNPIVPACPGCVIKYSFLGYAADAAGLSTLPKAVDVSEPATPNTCTAATTVTIDGTNNMLWVPITGPDGNIVAEINAMGQNMGVVTTSFYKNTGAIRQRGGIRYLDRNITISPAITTYSTPVKIRLYFSKSEFDLLDADANSGLTGSNRVDLLRILKNNDACGATVGSTTTMITPTNNPSTAAIADYTHGTNGYVLQGAVSSFSSFYIGVQNITLPVNLLTFVGTLQPNTTTLLKWQSDNEVNLKHYVVERSINGTTFSAIGTVNANGNGNTVQNYSLVDNDVANLSVLTVYYRLKMVDNDGNFKYSSIVVITLADITAVVNVAPNPVVNSVKVAITAPKTGAVTCKITDNTGRTIIRQSEKVHKGEGNTITIDMGRLSSGTYYLELSGAGIDKNIKLQKL